MQIHEAIKPAQCLSLALLPTPFHLLERFSASLEGPRIWIKRDDLSECSTSGNKIRKLEYVLAKALSDGCDTVITCGGLQSNHCRTTAILAARLGLKCILILRGNRPNVLTGNTLLDDLTGAEIQFHETKYYQENLTELLFSAQQKVLKQGAKAMIIPTGASDGVGAWGYIKAAFELKNDFQENGISPAAIIHATGSGGTQAGLTLGMHLNKLYTPIHAVNVCDDAQYFKDKLKDDWQHWQQLYDPQKTVDLNALPINVIEGYVGPGYGKAGADVFEIIKTLAQLEGVILDPCYTGKAFLGLVEEIRIGRFKDANDIVFLHTGGIFSNFAYIEQYNK